MRNGRNSNNATNLRTIRYKRCSHITVSSLVAVILYCQRFVGTPSLAKHPKTAPHPKFFSSLVGREGGVLMALNTLCCSGIPLSNDRPRCPTTPQTTYPTPSAQTFYKLGGWVLHKEGFASHPTSPIHLVSVWYAREYKVIRSIPTSHSTSLLSSHE